MNDPSIQSYLDEKEKEFNKLGFFKIREDRDESRVPSYPWSVLFIRYEAYCYDSGTTLEKYNRKFHNKLIRHKNGDFTFPKKATENPYCFIYMDLNEITVYDILPESELGIMFSNLANHKSVGVPTIHKYTPMEFMEISKLALEYQSLMSEAADYHEP